MSCHDLDPDAHMFVGCESPKLATRAVVENFNLALCGHKVAA